MKIPMSLMYLLQIGLSTNSRLAARKLQHPKAGGLAFFDNGFDHESSQLWVADRQAPFPNREGLAAK